MHRPANPIPQLWPLPPDGWRLNPGQVHVWSALLDQPQAITAAFEETLSQEERGKAARFRSVADRSRYIVGRGLLRRILASYLGANPTRLSFSYGPHGKPELAENSPLKFNLSHSGGMALVAVCEGWQVGVDLEKLCWMAETEDIVRRFFSAREQAEFRCAPLAEQQRTFFKLWTRREACLKCAGLGIGSLEQHEATPEFFTGTSLELCPSPEFAAALAIAGRPFALSTWQWPFDSL